MKLTVNQLADILQASETLVQTALDSDLGIRNLELKQEYAVAYLTWAMLTQITLPENHTYIVERVKEFCGADILTYREICTYLHDPCLAPDPKGQNSLVMLVPADIHQFTASTIEEFERQSLPLPDGYLATLTFLGYHTPTLRFDPFLPHLTAYLPRPTQCPERQVAEAELLGVLNELDDGQIFATTLLLYVVSRDRYVDLNVITALSMVRSYLDSMHSQQRKGSESRSTGLLRKHYETSLRELGLRPQDLNPRHSAQGPGLATALLLRVMMARATSDGVMRVGIPHLDSETRMWLAIQAVEEEIESAAVISPSLFARYNLLMLSALWLNRASPGSALSTLRLVAAANLGVEPLWHWKTIAKADDGLSPGTPAALCALLMKQLEVTAATYTSEMKEESRYLLRKLGGHLLACLSRLGVRFPEHHTSIHRTLESWGQASSLPLEQEELNALERRAFKLLSELEDANRQHALFHSAVTDDESLVFDSSVTSDAVEPEYLSEGRSLLAGKRVVIMGDIVRPERCQRLEKYFDLASLDWIAADEYAHGSHARHRIEGKADVVLLAIRKMGHAHSTLKDVAKQLGIPCVLLPGGMNERTIAMQVYLQMGQSGKIRVKTLLA